MRTPPSTSTETVPASAKAMVWLITGRPSTTADCCAARARTAKRIEELGLPCRDVVSGPTGLRQVFVKAPDGNMFCLHHRYAPPEARPQEPVGAAEGGVSPADLSA